MFQWIDDMWNDVRHALRAFRKNLGFSAVAILMLALGIGGATVMFTILNGVLFKPLPYPEPDRLVTMQERTEIATALGNLWAFAYPNFLDLQRETKLLDVAALRGDFFGPPVHLAARIVGVAPPASVVVSAEIRERIADVPGLGVVGVGPTALSGFERPVELFRLART